MPQQPQPKSISTDESNVSSAPKTFNEKRLDLWTGGHAKGHTLISLLPDRGTDCLRQEVPSHGADRGSVSSGSPSAGALNTRGPSHGHREHVVKAAAQENSKRLTQSKPVRRYEWPLIVNGVYQVRTRTFQTDFLLFGTKA